MGLRRSEWVLVAFFAYTSILACVLPVEEPLRRLTLISNAGVVSGCWLLRWAETLRHRRFFNIVRDWYPVPFILLAYRELGWFAPAQRTYSLERAWIVWDKLLLNQWGLKAFVEAAGPIGPAILEVAYLSYYALPLSAVAILYVSSARPKVDRLLTQLLMAVFLAYALFPLFPSEPPRTVFPGEDLPSHETVIRALNLWILGDWGIHTSVFPSVHATASFSIAFAMLRLLPGRKWVGRSLLLMAVLITVATVYGRYHYAVDGLAGLATALVALLVSLVIERRSGL